MNHATQQVPQSSFAVQDQRFDALVIATKLFDPFNWVEENQVTLFDLALLRALSLIDTLGMTEKTIGFSSCQSGRFLLNLKPFPENFSLKTHG